MRLHALVLPLAFGIAIAATPAAAQGGGRIVERHPFGDNDGKLLGYYAAVVAFSPLQAPMPTTPWSLELGIEGSYIPSLSEVQRTAGRDKPETTNLAHVLPRPRLAFGLPGGLRLEGSWVPPIRMFDLKANLFAVALSAPVATLAGVRITPRVAYTGGRVSGPVTCNTELVERNDVSLAIYYQYVCHSRESDDHFEPRQFSGELIGSRSIAKGAVQPYVGVGAMHERTRFDIGVIRDDGTRDTDHPILEMRTTRGYGVAGATWLAPRGARFSSELFWAPGSLFTVRLLAAIRVHGR